ncbi:unnamed protein product [Amoebophrya sp. A120]|nr:unnamed protein product [Amoebophrya sp. A120]|eukprot:GSA120T00002077001.1
MVEIAKFMTKTRSASQLNSDMDMQRRNFNLSLEVQKVTKNVEQKEKRENSYSTAGQLHERPFNILSSYFMWMTTSVHLKRDKKIYKDPVLDPRNQIDEINRRALEENARRIVERVAEIEKMKEPVTAQNCIKYS